MKYKLIKTYPGSPPIGTILTEIVIVHECSCVYMSDNMFYVESSNRVENQPEYWEKVEEMPEYIRCTETKEPYFIKGNIYKVIDSENKRSVEVISNIKCSTYPAGSTLFVTATGLLGTKYYEPATKEEYDEQLNKVLFITDDGIEIHKDDNYWFFSKNIHNSKPIAALATFRKKDYLVIKQKYYLFSTEQAANDFLKSLRKPLFTTEDGVDIFEGDKYWVVTVDFFINFMDKAFKGSGEQSTIKYFSTEEEAKKYVDLNKPIYSKRDAELIIFNTIYEFYLQSLDYLDKERKEVLIINDLYIIKNKVLNSYNL